MKLNIAKPLVVVKVHTTGLDPAIDRVVCITINRYDPDGRHRSGTRLINPERDIPQEAVAIHGITNEMVESAKTFDQMAKSLFEFINDADIAGFNIRFDVEMLAAEFGRSKLEYTIFNRDIIDLYDIYIKRNPRNFAAAIAQYVDPNFTMEQPMSTGVHVELCEKLMDSMIAPMGEKEDDVQTLLKKGGVYFKALDLSGWFVLDADRRAIFNVGKHKGQPVADVLISNPDYYSWMKNKANLSKDVLDLAERIIKKAKSVAAEKA